MTPTPEQIAWAAGLFEGEGTISVTRPSDKRNHRRALRFRMGLNMTDEDIIRRFAEIVGGNVSGPQHSASMIAGRQKPRWCWQVTAIDEVHRVFLMLAPWLGERRLETACRIFEEFDALPPPMPRSERQKLARLARFRNQGELGRA